MDRWGVVTWVGVLLLAVVILFYYKGGVALEGGTSNAVSKFQGGLFRSYPKAG